jgi:hypothetical protein
LEVTLWLRREAAHPCLRRVQAVYANASIHYFRFARIGELDGAFDALLKESYAVECRTQPQPPITRGIA